LVVVTDEGSYEAIWELVVKIVLVVLVALDSNGGGVVVQNYGGKQKILPLRARGRDKKRNISNGK
jgi:tartrate dehydratase beta subunit/fumarate hydratase class I family protein